MSGRGGGGGGGRRGNGRGGRVGFAVRVLTPWQTAASKRAFVSKHQATFCAFDFCMPAPADQRVPDPPPPPPPAADGDGEGAGRRGGGRRRRRRSGAGGVSLEAVVVVDGAAVEEAGDGAAAPPASRRRRSNSRAVRDRRLPEQMPPHIEADPVNDPDSIVCTICCAALVNATLVPCGHNSYCMHCCTTLMDNESPSCPACRQAIGQVLPRYDVIGSRVAAPLPALAAAAAAPAAVAAPLPVFEADDRFDIMEEIRRHRQQVEEAANAALEQERDDAAAAAAAADDDGQ